MAVFHNCKNFNIDVNQKFLLSSLRLWPTWKELVQLNLGLSIDFLSSTASSSASSLKGEKKNELARTMLVITIALVSRELQDIIIQSRQYCERSPSFIFLHQYDKTTAFLISQSTFPCSFQTFTRTHTHTSTSLETFIPQSIHSTFILCLD